MKLHPFSTVEAEFTSYNKLYTNHYIPPDLQRILFLRNECRYDVLTCSLSANYLYG